MYRLNSVLPKAHHEQIYPSLNQLIGVMNQLEFGFPLSANGKAVLDIKFNESLKPVRKVVRRSNFKQSDELFSKKMNTTISCESPIELNGCYIFETNPFIKKYHMQPAVISYLINEEMHHHIPDALIEFSVNKRCFVEFKAERDLNDSHLQQRTDLLGRHLPAHGYGYLLVCGNQMGGNGLKNAKQISHIERTEVSVEIMNEIRHYLDQENLISIQSLIDRLKQVKNIKNIIYELIKKGVIGYSKNDEEVISNKTHIYWKGLSHEKF